MEFTTTDVNKAIVYSEPGVSWKTEVVELPVPKPGPGEILVRLLYSGVCHTDAAFCSCSIVGLPTPTPKGQIGGHEGIGVVLAHGADVDTPALNSRVGLKYILDACLTCDHCLEGGDSSCQKAKIAGYFTPGTFQQYSVISSRYVTPIPDTLDPAAAAPLMCGGVTVYTALKRAGLRPGQSVVVTGGGGGLGHLAIQYAKTMGGKVLAIDSGTKKNLCLDIAGADEFIDFTQFESDEALAAKVKELTQGGARIVLQCTSSPKVYSQAPSWLGFRGTLVCLGIPEKEGSLVPMVTQMIADELTIMAIKAGNRLDVKECLELAAQGHVKTHYKLRGMDELTEVFGEMERGEIEGRVVIDLR